MPGYDTDVVVVGAGVMGLATARVLAQSGRDVLVLEQFELGHARGSSHGDARIVRLSYPEARWIRLAQESFPLWRELEAESGRELLELHGTVDIGDWQPNRAALDECGIESEVLDAALGQSPGSAEGYNRLGIAYRRLGRMAEARAAYERAIAADPSLPAPHRNLGVLLDLYLGQPGPALERYEQYQRLAGGADTEADAWLAELRTRANNAQRTADAAASTGVQP